MAVEIIADPGATWRLPGEDWDVSSARMVQLVSIAKEAGADVFKIQLLRRGMYPDGDPAADLVAQYEVPADWLPHLANVCDSAGLEFMATCYRAEDVPLVDPYVKRHKVASFDALNHDLAAAIRATGKPVLVSMGLGQTWVEPFRGNGWWSTTALHCSSAYPTPPEQANMLRVRRLKTDARGFSDHTRGNTAAIMAVAMGATVIEKHLRHEETPPENPDYPAAASPAEFRAYVAAIREAEMMLGDGEHRVQPGELVQYRYNPAIGRRGGW